MAYDDHRYTSTACIHREHGECRLTCKFCEAPCRCFCHRAAAAAPADTAHKPENAKNARGAARQ